MSKVGARVNARDTTGAENQHVNDLSSLNSSTCATHVSFLLVDEKIFPFLQISRIRPCGFKFRSIPEYFSVAGETTQVVAAQTSLLLPSYLGQILAFMERSQSSVPIPSHEEFDALFEEFASHLQDGFMPSEISVKDWDIHYAHVWAVIDAWKGKTPSPSRRAQAVRSCFHEVRRGELYVIPKNAEAIWQCIVGAYTLGFLLDVVLESGPCPTKKWDSVVYTPVKVAPSPPLFVPRSSSLTLESARLSPNPVPQLESSSSSSSDGDLIPEIPTVKPLLPGSAGVPIGAAPPAAPLPQLAPKPTSVPVVLPGAFSFSPVYHAKAFKLRDFLPSFSNSSDDGECDTVIKNGKLMMKSNKARISSPHSWMVATSGLSRHFLNLQALGLEPSFSSVDFSLYVDMVLGFFQAYSFESVISFDVEFRKWRRFHGVSWSTDNPYLRVMLLKPKTTSAQSSTSTTTNTSGASKSGVCRDFNRGSCKRSNCIFPHVCAWCKQTGHTLSECKTAPSRGH